MKVRWTASARDDRQEIMDYIAMDSPRAAAMMDGLFAEAAAKLADFPHMGRAGRVSGTREAAPHENYRLVYEIADDVVWVLALVHAARRWPPSPTEG